MKPPLGFHLYLSIACLLLIGIPIWYMPTEVINPDAFGYISITNYYLFDIAPSFKDSFTVGPVIPLFLTLLKWIVGRFNSYSPQMDIYILRATALFFHLAIVNLCGVLLLRKAEMPQVFIFLIIFMGLGGLSRDFLSLNGELVSVALLLVLTNILSTELDASKIFISSLLVVLLVYTKVQSILLLVVLLFSDVGRRPGAFKVYLSIALSVFLAELFLYSQGIGLVRNIGNYFSYVGGSSQALTVNFSSYIASGLVYFYSVFSQMFLIMPVLAFLIIYFLLSGKVSASEGGKNWELWLVATFVTILIPHHPFDHYSLYAIVFMARFAGPVLSDISGRSPVGFRNNRTSFAIIYILILSKLLLLKADGVNWDVTNSNDLWWGAEAEQVHEIIEKDPGTILVHGWDYRFYSTAVRSNVVGEDLVMVLYGLIDANTYLNDLLPRRYKYIIDTVGYAGVIRNPEMQIVPGNIYGQTIYKYYNLIYNSGGLRLFERKKD